LPVYEYECTSCGNQFEIMQKITDKLLDSCPSCSGKVRKLVSNCSFKLKGSGWYVTDYAKKSEKKEEKKEEKSEKKKDKTSDSGEAKGKSSETTQVKAMNQ